MIAGVAGEDVARTRRFEKGGPGLESLPRFALELKFEGISGLEL